MLKGAVYRSLHILFFAPVACFSSAAGSQCFRQGLEGRLCLLWFALTLEHCSGWSYDMGKVAGPVERPGSAQILSVPPWMP